MIGTSSMQGILLRLPESLRLSAMKMAEQECLSLNLFIASALAEKIHRLELEHQAKKTPTPGKIVPGSASALQAASLRTTSAALAAASRSATNSSWSPGTHSPMHEDVSSMSFRVAN